MFISDTTLGLSRPSSKVLTEFFFGAVVSWTGTAAFINAALTPIMARRRTGRKDFMIGSVNNSDRGKDCYFVVFFRYLYFKIWYP